MSSIHSEEMNVTITGNILTRHSLTMNHISQLGVFRGSFTVSRNGGTDQNPLFDMSFPMTEVDRKLYAGLIHRMNNENKLGKKLDTGNGKPDNDPTPPGRGGGAKVAEFVNTQAIAA